MKRFTETDKWKDPSFLKMKPVEKLVYFYIMDNCNNAGFMEWDIDICAMFTGMKSEHVSGAYEGLNRGFVGAKNSNWIYVPEFLKLQKNLPLNSENNAHRQIIAIVEDMRPLFASIAEDLLGPNKGLGRGIGKGKVNGKVKVTDYTPEFEEWWKVYPKRKGSNPKDVAFKKWKLALNEKGVTAELLQRGAETFRAFCEGEGNVGTAFVPMASTWLNQKRWGDELDIDENGNGAGRHVDLRKWNPAG